MAFFNQKSNLSSPIYVTNYHFLHLTEIVISHVNKKYFGYKKKQIRMPNKIKISVSGINNAISKISDPKHQT